MVDRTAKLEAALRVNAALLVHAQRLIAAYIAPESDRAAIISELIRLLDGPAHREAKRLAERALGEDSATSRDARIGCCDDPILAESATNKIGSQGQRAMERNGLDAATKPSNFFVIRSGRKRNGSDQNADQALPRRGRFF